MQQSSGEIQSLSLQKFAAFEKADFNFCSGINVFIGTNGTGKTLLIKACTLNSSFNKIFQRTKSAYITVRYNAHYNITIAAFNKIEIQELAR